MNIVSIAAGISVEEANSCIPAKDYLLLKNCPRDEANRDVFPIPRTFLCVCQMAWLGLFTTIFLPPYTAAP